MDSLSDDAICGIATFCTPHDLLNLARTCQHFGAKPGSFIVKSKKERRRIYSTRMRQMESTPELEGEGREWSLIEEAAREIVETEKETDEIWNVSNLSQRMTEKESWILVYHRLEQWKRTPLKFSRIIGNGISFVKGDISHVQAKHQCGYTEDSLAICQEVMKTGRHYAEFTIKIPVKKHRGWRGVPVGILRPINDDARTLTKTKVKMVHGSREFRNWYIPLPGGYESYCRDHSKEVGFEGDEHSFFVCMSLDRSEPDVVIGFLLDLNEGTLTKYIGGRKFGVIKRGLRGHYSWTVYPRYCNVKIRQAPIPADA